MKPNPSQYPGTLKKSVCSRCGKNLSNKTRVEQDEHVKECTKQQKLSGS